MKSLGLRELLAYASPLTPPHLLTDAQGNYGEAEELYKRSLAIHEQLLGPDHPNVAISLNNLARLWESQVRVDP